MDLFVDLWICDYVNPDVSTNNKVDSDNTPIEKFDPHENIFTFLE